MATSNLLSRCLLCRSSHGPTIDLLAALTAAQDALVAANASSPNAQTRRLCLRRNKVLEQIETFSPCSNPQHARNNPKCHDHCKEDRCRVDGIPDSIKSNSSAGSKLSKHHNSALIGIFQCIVLLDIATGLVYSLTETLLNRLASSEVRIQVNSALPASHIKTLVAWIITDALHFDETMLNSRSTDFIMILDLFRNRLRAEAVTSALRDAGQQLAKANSKQQQEAEVLEWTIKTEPVLLHDESFASDILNYSLDGSVRSCNTHDAFTDRCASLFKTCISSMHLAPKLRDQCMSNAVATSRQVLYLDPLLREIIMKWNSRSAPPTETVLQEAVDIVITSSEPEQKEFAFQTLVQFIQSIRVEEGESVATMFTEPIGEHPPLIDTLQSSGSVPLNQINDLRHGLGLRPLLSQIGCYEIRSKLIDHMPGDLINIVISYLTLASTHRNSHLADKSPVSNC